MGKGPARKKRKNMGQRRRKGQKGKGNLTKSCNKKCRQRKRQLRQKKGGKKGKGKGKKRNRNNNNNRQTSTLPSCFSKMFKYASKYKKAGNIFRQVKRTEGNKDKIEKKGKKRKNTG